MLSCGCGTPGVPRPGRSSACRPARPRRSATWPAGCARGFGSVRVRATIGTSTWTTSIFPDSQAGYVLPVKRAVRVAEALDVGDVAMVTVELIDFT